MSNHRSKTDSTRFWQPSDSVAVRALFVILYTPFLWLHIKQTVDIRQYISQDKITCHICRRFRGIVVQSRPIIPLYWGYLGPQLPPTYYTWVILFLISLKVFVSNWFQLEITCWMSISTAQWPHCSCSVWLVPIDDYVPRPWIGRYMRSYAKILKFGTWI